MFVGGALPVQEYPNALIQTWKDRPVPASFGPVCSHWYPRITYAGTYDMAWQKSRSPYLPKDFDSRFFHSAPSDQIVSGYLKGGEPVVVRGASEEPELSFVVPDCRQTANFRIGVGETEVPLNMETFLIDLNTRTLALTWACQFTHTPRIQDVREMELTTTFNN
jgi:hypothetical protein